jgi:hypothetical protein
MVWWCRPLASWLCRPVRRPTGPGYLVQAGTHSLRTSGLYGVVVSPYRELAVQTGEAARAICSRLGLTVSVQVDCMVWWCCPLVSWLCRPVMRPGPSAPGWGSQSPYRWVVWWCCPPVSWLCAVRRPMPSAAGWGSQSPYRWVPWCGGVALTGAGCADQ